MKKVCKNCKGNFFIEPEDFLFYEKMNVPPPTWCPHCRFIRRTTFVNERSLYKSICHSCGDQIISMFHPDIQIPIWCSKCTISDTWDASIYGRNYDFSRNFFKQFKELKYNVPHRALDKNEHNGMGCEYSNYCFTSKDVYLSFDVTRSEHIKYSEHVLDNNKNCLDSLIIKDNDRGYELVQASHNYNSSFLIESDQCIDSHFLYDSSNCSNCCLSHGLRNKSYVFKNQQFSKEDYKKALQSLHLEKYSGQLSAKSMFFQMVKNAIHKYAHIKNSFDAIGDFIENSKNIQYCYGFADSENVKYSFLSSGAVKDSHDLIFSRKNEECYECALAGKRANKIFFSFNCRSECKNLFYCDGCRNCSDCFGCVGLVKRQYCILNKQYSKKEYEEAVEKIKIHMKDTPYVDIAGREYTFGEYFPIEISPFAYNETTAFEENPLSKSEVIRLGYKWRDMEVKSRTPTTTFNALPDNINDVADDICNEVIECENRGKAETQCTYVYKILADELVFYRQMNLPIPRYCPNCRYHQRLVWKNPFRFYEKQCMCNLSNHQHMGNCLNKFQTMYPPDKEALIYCKQCYQQEIY